MVMNEPERTPAVGVFVVARSAGERDSQQQQYMWLLGLSQQPISELGLQLKRKTIEGHEGKKARGCLLVVFSWWAGGGGGCSQNSTPLPKKGN